MSMQAQDSDVEMLHRLGYAQELRRRMGGFSNFAIISILSGCMAEELAKIEAELEAVGQPATAGAAQ